MADALRLAFVSPRAPRGSGVGGAETLIYALAREAAAQGSEVAFLTTCATDHFTWANVVPPGCESIDGMQVHFFPVNANRDPDLLARAQQRIASRRQSSVEDEQVWLDNGVTSDALYAHLASHGDDYDHILVGPYPCGLSVYASRVHPERTRLIPCLHDEDFARLSCVSEMFRSVRGHIFNAAAEQRLAERFYGLGPERGAVVGMGLESQPADPDAGRRLAGFDAPYVMYAGRREPLKGTPLLLDYLNAFRARTGIDVKLVLTGAGKVEPPPSLSAHMRDLGFVSEQEKVDLMAGAVAFCHASVNESFSIVLMESWLAGRPVLVHRGSEVMRDHCIAGNGGLWFGNYPEFEEALRALLTQADAAAAMGAAGRDYVEATYSWPSVMQRFFAALTTDPAAPAAL